VHAFSTGGTGRWGPAIGISAGMGAPMLWGGGGLPGPCFLSLPWSDQPCMVRLLHRFLFGGGGAAFLGKGPRDHFSWDHPWRSTPTLGRVLVPLGRAAHSPIFWGPVSGFFRGWGGGNKGGPVSGPF